MTYWLRESENLEKTIKVDKVKQLNKKLLTYLMQISLIWKKYNFVSRVIWVAYDFVTGCNMNMKAMIDNY